MKRSELDDAIDEIFGEKEVERKFRGYRGCITVGLKLVDDFSHCGNGECPSCNMYQEVFREQIKKIYYGNRTNT